MAGIFRALGAGDFVEEKANKSAPQPAETSAESNSAKIGTKDNVHISRRNDAPENGNYSQQFDFSEMLAAGSYTDLNLAYMPIEITKPDGTHITTVKINKFGMTNRIYTEQAESIVAWVGTGTWGVSEEFELSEEDEEAAEEMNV